MQFPLAAKPTTVEKSRCFEEEGDDYDDGEYGDANADNDAFVLNRRVTRMRTGLDWKPLKCADPIYL